MPGNLETRFYHMHTLILLLQIVIQKPIGSLLKLAVGTL